MKIAREFWIINKDLGADGKITKGTFLCSVEKPAPHFIKTFPDDFILVREVLPDEQSKISELEDKLCHATREVDEVKYLLGHKIELLEKQNKIMRNSIEFISNISGLDPASSWAEYHAREALKEIEEME